MIRAVIPSVQYADMLADTLPAIRAWLPAKTQITVVTAHRDRETLRLARRHHVNCLITSAWSSDGAAFNKARALDEAFGFVDDDRDGPNEGDLCISLDADVFPGGPFPHTELILPNVIYGCPRYTCPDPETLRAYRDGRLDPTTLGMRNGGHRVAGYCQVFRYRPGLRYGSWPTAGHYDLAFHQHFRAKAELPGCYMLHLGQTSSRNWNGRRVLPPWTRAS